jgi:hypothetical protein
MPEQGRLRIHGSGEVEVELVIAYLGDLRHAYNSIILFESMIDGLERAERDFPFPRYPFGLYLDWPVGRRRGIGHIREWPSRPEEVASFVPASEQLVLSAVRLSSPGSWDFLGALNPLEVLRKVINDRHERRKDKEYRESAEKRRLELENQILETELISRRIAVARKLGATKRDLAPFLNELVYRPILQLDRSQDRGVITYAEIPKPDNEKDQ